MCHDPGSRPPAPPADAVADPRQLARTGELQLTSADGTAVTAYEAIPTGEPRARVVVLPDIRGLHPYYRALAERFAEAGFATIAVDYFGRTAAALPRDDDFDFRPHVQQVTPQHVTDDVSAAVERLSPGGADPVFTVGFCFGGGHSWRLAARGLALAGAIGFYGRPGLVEEASEAQSAPPAPILMLVAGADHAIPAADVLATAERLRERGADVEAYVFEAAPHSFFDRTFAEHADACDEAWRLMAAFVDRNVHRHAGGAARG